MRSGGNVDWFSSGIVAFDAMNQVNSADGNRKILVNEAKCVEIS